MFSLFFSLFDSSGFMPRRFCGNWSSGLILLHNLADAMTFLAYFAIPAILIHLIRRRIDTPFRPIFALFGAFIFACGLTHLLEIVVFYAPIYRLIGVVKLVTGVISLVTAAALFRIVPRALALRDMNSMEREIHKRRCAEEAAAARARLLEVLVELSRSALEKGSLDSLAHEVASLAARGLDVTRCGVFQALPGRTGLLLLSGVGWRAELVGAARVPAVLRSLARFASQQPDPEGDTGLENSTDFENELLEREHNLSGGLSMEVDAPDGSHSVLIAYTKRPQPFVILAHDAKRAFGEEEEWFLRSVAALLGSNIGRIEAEQALLNQARTDSLTGLHNARHLREESRVIEQHAAQVGNLISAVMIDVDFFKSYNDTFGHLAGDEVLRDVGVILRREAREGDVVARYGGEEFAVLLPGTEATEAFAFADRLRRAIADHPWTLRPVTASFGVATSGPLSPGIVPLLDRADQALYASKRAGRNRVSYSPNDDSTVAMPGSEEPGTQNQRELAIPEGSLLLHIDDDPAYRYALGRHLKRAGFRIVEAGTGAEGLALATDSTDLILLDIHLPDCDGFDLCRRLKANPGTAAIPVLSLSGVLFSGSERIKALVSGASAAMVKSNDPKELLAVVSTLVRARRGQRDLGQAWQEMGEKLREQVTETEVFCNAAIDGWAGVLELRDHETEGHSRRVTELTTRVARHLNFDEQEIIHLRRGALLHDIGKIGVPDSILNKPGPLDSTEWSVMRRHPELARRMLEPIKFLHPALAIPCCHHERWDGTGYPDGLKGDNIPLAARIFAAVDIFDALSHDRPYRKAWPVEKVRDYIRSLSGTQLDPDVVVAILAVV